MPAAPETKSAAAASPAYGTNNASQPATRPLGMVSASSSGRVDGSVKRMWLPRQVSPSPARPVRRGARSVTPVQVIGTASAASAAATQSTCSTASRWSSDPPIAKPSTCMTPTETFIAERASAYSLRGRTSARRPQRTPLPMDSTKAPASATSSRVEGVSGSAAWSTNPTVVAAPTAQSA